jgi:acetylornithine/succinyldiaminopimelate/putrescine aminotransferase
MTAAKALGGGLPVGAAISSPELGDVFARGDHGSTFAGSPVTAAAALAALGVIGDESLLASVVALGERLRAGLAQLGGVTEVRGRGLMVGLSLAGGIDAREVADRALAAGLVINVPGDGMLRLLPPLVISEAEIDHGLEILASALAQTP